ncbi:hypothetical protein [Propioniciclava sinopodophylli]|nr:hypothetical protein [Propioniciclava sinopodophylli]
MSLTRRAGVAPWVGAGSQVGANALVVHDVPHGPVVTGVVADAIDPVA